MLLTNFQFSEPTNEELKKVQRETHSEELRYNLTNSKTDVLYLELQKKP